MIYLFICVIVWIGDKMVKKLIVICVCLLLCGCRLQGLSYGSGDENQTELIGEFVHDDLRLTLIKHQSGELEYAFEFISTGVGINEFAHYVDHSQKEAIFDKQDDGYILTFSIEEDKVTVKEIGLSFLDTDLTGDYIRE